MFDFLSIAGQCKKSHRLVAYIVGCAVTLAFLICAIVIVCRLTQYSEISISLLNLVEVKAVR